VSFADFMEIGADIVAINIPFYISKFLIWKKANKIGFANPGYRKTIKNITYLPTPLDAIYGIGKFCIYSYKNNTR